MMKPIKMGDNIFFHQIAKLLEDTSKETSGPNKKRKLKKFIDKCREHFQKIHSTLNSEEAGGDSIFPAIRILLPTEDLSREAYHFKAQNLGRMLGEILGLPDKDKKRLSKFKDPEKSGPFTGDFASLVQDLMKSRFSDNENSNLSLSQLHDVLDRIARTPNVNQNMQKKELLELFIEHKLSPLEGKWLCRLLLKSLGLGISRNVIFDLIHQNARDVFDRVHNLETLCQRLNDPNCEVEGINVVSLFNYCKPMLALRTQTLDDFDGNQQSETTSERPSSSSGGRKQKHVAKLSPPFIIETKWDGERFQAHYDGYKLVYYSRQGHDKFTDNFEETLTPRLRPQILPGVRSFIIDGEMMAWNKPSKTYTDKGNAVDVKKFRPDNINHCPCFVVFDVLLFNDEVLIDKPLHERMEILKKVIKSKEGAVIVAEKKTVETKQEVEDELNNAISNREEGLIVKGINSIYIPGFRGPTWRKLKPEYIHGTTVDDLDLLILGAYFSESKTRGGLITHFLVGVIDKTGPSEEFYPVAQVGSGCLKKSELHGLVASLGARLETVEYKNVHYKARKRPDRFIDPSRSTVLQIKASEINPSDMYSIRYALRFPRIIKVRDDKRYNDIMSVQEFHDLRQSCGGKLAKRTDGGKNYFKRKNQIKTAPESDTEQSDYEDEKPSPSKLFKDDQKPGPSNSGTPTKVFPISTVPPKTLKKMDIFNGKIFCVYGSSNWKLQMEESIISYGGTITQNPVKEKFWIVGESQTNFKVSKAINLCQYDVLKPNWILNSISSKKEVDFKPQDFFSYTNETWENLFQIKYDEYGDSYTDMISLDDTKELLNKIVANLETDSDTDSSELDVEEINNEISSVDEGCWKRIKGYNFFQNIRISFEGDFDQLIAANVEFYGGKVLKNDNLKNSTHVIANDPSSNEKQHLNAILVKPTWVQDCINQRKLLSGSNYSPDFLT